MAWKAQSSILTPRCFPNRAFSLSVQCALHTSPCVAGSPLLNLSGLSNSRESQYFSKERGIPRTRFSPHLELIEASEVSPFTSPKSSRPDKQELLNESMDTERELLVISKYFMQELEGTRKSLKKLKNENQRLEEKVVRNEAIASTLFLASILLIYLLAFPEKKRTIYDRTFGQWLDLVGDKAEDAQTIPHISGDVRTSTKPLQFTVNVLTPPEPPTLTASQSSISKYFWVS